MISGHFGKEKKMNYKMILQYDGTRYNGWQKQGNTDNTIQGKLETLLSRIGSPFCTIGTAGAPICCDTA